MGIWIRSPKLNAGEEVRWRCAANRAQGKRAVGGFLFLMTERFVFQPNRVDALTLGRPWEVETDAVASICRAEANGELFSGGLRARLQIRTDYTTELFVTYGVDRKVLELTRLLGLDRH